ncbi:cytochrome P450 [Mycolicibacter heraklionensis]|uniref:Cytochrome P450 n=1 Tax=Mycolicibacter heraklionensis TaxID=512402 RepID=A0A9X7WE71_9MYCO|nr:cytochrome P450 [Mycolicibacter heraklionensis]QZA06242.1 cytochrome P450 [Mycolicibacter heraklionensis]
MPSDLLHPPARAIAAAARTAIGDLGRPFAVGAYRDLRRPRARLAPAAVPRTTFDPTLPESIANPHPDFERIREHPVVVNERLGVWMLGRYADVHAAARDNEIFSSSHGIMLRSTPGPSIITTDPPNHERLRRVTQPMFSKKSIASFTDDIRELAADGVKQLQRGEVVDMVPALTIPLPVNVIARVLGVPRDQWEQFRAVSDRWAQIFSPRTIFEVLRLTSTSFSAYIQYRSFVAAELKRRAGSAGAEVLDRLRLAVDTGEISDQEAFYYALIVLVAGNETTTNLLGMLLIRLAQDPELFAALRADRSLLGAAVEETARWGSPVQWVTRIATADCEIGGAVVPRDARVVLFYASANRDPLKFPDPNRFDVHRATAAHLGFGHGIHFCLGAHLARLEVVTAIDYLLDEVDGLELAGPVRWGTTPSLQGPASVPLRVRKTA